MIFEYFIDSINNRSSIVYHTNQQQSANYKWQIGEYFGLTYHSRIDHLVGQVDAFDSNGDSHVAHYSVVVVVLLVGFLDCHEYASYEENSNRQSHFHFDCEQEDETTADQQSLYEHEVVILGTEFVLLELLSELTEELRFHQQKYEVSNQHQ